MGISAGARRESLCGMAALPGFDLQAHGFRCRHGTGLGIQPGQFFGLFTACCLLGQPVFQTGIHQRTHPIAMGGGNRHRIAQPQRMELGSGHGPGNALGLVDGQNHLAGGAAQLPGDFLVAGEQPLAPVDHENHHIGLDDGLPGLAGHLLGHAGGGDRLEAAGIDQHDTLVVDGGRAIVTVTGQAGDVGHQRITRTRQTVEQGGFADVRPPHERDNRYGSSHVGRSGGCGKSIWNSRPACPVSGNCPLAALCG